MPKFFDDLKGKAQSAINASPLAAYVPGHEQQGGTQPASSQGSQGGGRSHALGALQHQFRTLQVQYGGANKDLRQLQLIITGQKGVVLDLEKEAQDAKAVSKEFYIWGQSEDSDIKDVSDRLAYLTYVQGSLAATLASSLDACRAPLKAVRDAEAHLQPKRNLRAGYDLQISRLKNEAKPGTEHKLKEVEMLLKKAEAEDEPLEKEVELLKRKAIIESETQKWQAVREYGEKLVLLSQACAPIVAALPSVPPTTTNPYGGAAATAATRATLQKALDNYKPGNITLPASGTDSETRSFGETHASELSRISSVADHHHAPPARGSSSSLTEPEHGLPPQPTALPPVAIPSHPTGGSVSAATSAPVNPHDLNNSPAPIPSSSPDSIPATTSAEPLSPTSGGGSVPTNTPTVAETGMPVSAGKEGPGPASGSLAGGRRGSQGSSTTGNPIGPGYGEPAPSYGGVDSPKYGLNDAGTPARYESAEDEKKRLEREDRERVLRGNAPPSSFHAPPATSTSHETAEEEKKRLEREERERVLRAGNSGDANPGPPAPGPDGGDGSVPPPYMEPR